jgi:hypothetical protein
MHITNLQLVLALFFVSNLTAYLLGRRHGRRALREEFLAGPVGKLALGTLKTRRRS